MTTIQSFAGAFLASLAIGAIAQTPASPAAGESRAQVQAETVEAIRNGDIVWGEPGHKLNEISPSHYSMKSLSQGATREEIRADLAKARRNGEIPDGEVGKTPRDINPRLYPAQPMEAGLTRAQVRTETQAAIRAGNVQLGETGKTLAELNPSRYQDAGARVPTFSLNRRSRAPASAASEAAIAN